VDIVDIPFQMGKYFP